MTPTEVLISSIIIMVFLGIGGWLNCISSYNNGYRNGYDDAFRIADTFVNELNKRGYI